MRWRVDRDVARKHSFFCFSPKTCVEDSFTLRRAEASAELHLWPLTGNNVRDDRRNVYKRPQSPAALQSTQDFQMLQLQKLNRSSTFSAVLQSNGQRPEWFTEDPTLSVQEQLFKRILKMVLKLLEFHDLYSSFLFVSVIFLCIKALLFFQTTADKKTVLQAFQVNKG